MMKTLLNTQFRNSKNVHSFLKLGLKVFLFCCGFIFLACDRDKNNPGYDYFPDMAYSKAYETYASNPNFPDGKTLQPAVEGTVSREDREVYPLKKTDEDLLKAAKILNPLTPDSQNLKRGKVVYQNVCLHCHGATGDGKGHLYTSGKYPYPPANLLTPKAKAYADGQIYHIISVGIGIMAPHAIIVRPDDRWKTVMYVRNLQNKK